MSSILRAWLAILCLSSSSAALKCYVCNTCIKYELSQAQTCTPPTDTHCMKMDLQSGQVQRRCATEEMCKNAEEILKMNFDGVSCCTTDKCNGGPSLGPPGVAVYAALGVSLLLVFTFYQKANQD